MSQMASYIEKMQPVEFELKNGYAKESLISIDRISCLELSHMFEDFKGERVDRNSSKTIDIRYRDHRYDIAMSIPLKSDEDELRMFRDLDDGHKIHIYSLSNILGSTPCVSDACSSTSPVLCASDACSSTSLPWVSDACSSTQRSTPGRSNQLAKYDASTSPRQ